MSVEITHTGIDLQEVYARNQAALKDAPRVAGVYMRDHFKDNIAQRKGMPENGTLRPFRGREFTLSKDTNKNPLRISGNLMNSIRIISVNGSRVIVGIDNDKIATYAEVMQNGGEIVVSKKMKSFFWAKYYETTGREVYSVKTKEKTKTKRNKSLNHDAEIYRAMALKKEGSVIKIEARTFMKITTDVQKGITREMKKLFGL
jgi:phage gpG-like protein